MTLEYLEITLVSGEKYDRDGYILLSFLLSLKFHVILSVSVLVCERFN